MRHRFFVPIVALASILVVSSGAAAQRGAAPAAPSVPHDPKDLSGVWTKTWRTLTLSAEAPPFTAEGKARFDANKPSYGPHAIPPALGNDPTGFCDPLGLTRNLILEVSVYPMEIVQTPKRVLQFFEWAHAWREIWTDGRPLPTNPEPRWLGYSVGRWEGDTFVVRSNGFDDRTWIDHFGNPHSDQMTLEERYRRVNRDTLELIMTLTDPVIFTRPWVSEPKNFRLAPAGREINELFCVPSEEQAFNKNVRDPAGGVTNR
jgi:hypothetical protein